MYIKKKERVKNNIPRWVYRKYTSTILMRVTKYSNM